MLKHYVLAAILICAVGVEKCGWTAEPAKVGEMLPEIKATDESGAVVTLNQFKDKLGVIVFFFPKAFTGG